MNNLAFKPTLNTVVLNNNLLWFKPSNKYIVVNSIVNELITFFLNTNSFEQFERKVLNHTDFSKSEILKFYNDISALLEECNQPLVIDEQTSITFNKSLRAIDIYYCCNQITFKICYSSEHLKSIIHPQIAHLEVNVTDKDINVTFDIHHDLNHLFLFKNQTLIKSFLSKDYHLLQGKFVMELLCLINGNSESDWLGTFHASTVRKKDKGIMLIGDSGSGKSTFTALLMANGFDLVADDITPILSQNQKVYPYPAGVSIKSGAFKTLNTIIPDFNKLEDIYINPFKGYVKYLPPNNESYITEGIDCNTLIYVNYKSKSKTTIEPIDVSLALQILIPESWIEPSEQNAKQFINWLKKLKCYKLTYSNYKEAILKVSDLI